MSSSGNTCNWWTQQLAEYRQRGRSDAERGKYLLPYPLTEEEDGPINAAYKQGFDERRKELGEKFAWR